MNDLEALRTMHFDAWCGMLLVISGRSRIVVRKRQAYCRTKQPDQALTLVETLARTTPLTRLDLDMLLMRRPVQAVDLALQGAELGDLPFHRIAQHLETDRLLAFVKKAPASFEYHRRWFSILKLETRLALYHTLMVRWCDSRGCMEPDLVALLPRAPREQEGRRHLALPALATRPEERLPYAAFLPWDEVANFLIEAATTGILHADALAFTCQQLSLVPGRYGQPGRPDSQQMRLLEEALGNHAHEYLRRIALAVLIIQASLPPGWTAERRARLQMYRADTSPLVAAAAQFTVIPPAEAER